MSQHVVIAGGGFGGYYAAKTLERVAPKDLRITLINDVNFMLYAPLLPGAAAGTLEPRHIVIPLRERLKRTQLRLGWVTGGDPSADKLCVNLLDGANEGKGTPYLRLIRWLPHWRIYAVTLPHPMVIPAAGADIRLTRLGSDEMDYRVRRPGSALVRVRWSPYWRVDKGCVERAGDWTRVTATSAGELRMWTSFSPERVLLRGRRCG